MSDINALCDDILKIIITLLDDDGCIMLARTCHHLHDLVHCTRTCITMTDNVFEAVRCGSLLSFTHAHVTNVELQTASSMNNITTDMLKYIYSQTKYDDVAYQLCKRGVLTNVDDDLRQCKLVVHAIMHDKHDLLMYMKSIVGRNEYKKYCAYGAAKKGDVDMFEEYRNSIHEPYDVSLKYYANIGCCTHIIDIVDADDGEDCELSYLKYLMMIIKRDYYASFDKVKHEMNVVHEFDMCVKYNALNIVRYCGVSVIIIEDDITSLQPLGPVDMTPEMVELLLELNCHSSVIKYIIDSRNYRLTEILRAKGLYDKKLTMRSAHYEYDN